MKTIGLGIGAAVTGGHKRLLRASPSSYCAQRLIVEPVMPQAMMSITSSFLK